MKNSEILKIVSKAIKVIPNEPALPVLEYMLIDKGKLITTNLAVWFCETRIEIETNPFLLPAKMVKKILSKLPKDADISFKSINEEKSCIEINGDPKFTFTVEAAHEFPVIPEPDIINGVLKPEDIPVIIGATKYIDTDKLRPAFCGVYLDEDIVATNGNVLYWKKMQGNLMKSIIIPKEIICMLDLNNKYSIHINKDKAWSKIHPIGASSFIICRNIDEKYPEYKDAIPVGGGAGWFVNPKEMLSKMELALLTANPTTKQVKWSFDNKNITIESQDLWEQIQYKDTLKVDYISVPDFEIGINCQFIINLLKNRIKNDVVKFEVEASNKPIKVDDEMIVMPVLLS